MRALADVSQRAGNEMRTLRVGIPNDAGVELFDALLTVVTHNASTLKELELVGTCSRDATEVTARILRAGSALESLIVEHLVVGRHIDLTQLTALLSGDGLYKPLRVHWLDIKFMVLEDDDDALPQMTQDDDDALLRSISQHRSLRKFSISTGDDIRFDVNLACAAASAGALDFILRADDDDMDDITREVARLVTGFPIQKLELQQDAATETEFDDAFIAAVRDSRSLQTLILFGSVFYDTDTSLFEAVHGHPTISTIQLDGAVFLTDRAVMFASIASLLTVPSALTRLDLEKAGPMDIEAVQTLLGGLASPNCRLQELVLSEFTDDDEVDEMTPLFISNTMAPAVLACQSMRSVVYDHYDEMVKDAIEHLNALLRYRQ